MSRRSLAFMLCAASTLAAGAAEIRDPTRPPSAAARVSDAAREPAPVLSAVMSYDGKLKAIFNGRVVTDGSVVGAYVIVAVLKDGVRYRHADAIHELHLAHPATPFKKPAAAPARAPSGVQP